MEKIEVYLLYTEEEKKKMTSKKIENIRDQFELEANNEYFKMGIRGNHSNFSGTEMLKHESLGISNEVPRIFCKQFNLQRSVWVSNDITASEQSPYLAVGGVLNIEIFPLPEMPKKHRSWIIRNIQDMEDTLKKKNFPDSAGNIEPITVAFTIPEYVWIDEGREDVEVGWWNEEAKEWQLENLEEVKINKTTREVSFKTLQLAPFAYLQPRCTDFPYAFMEVKMIQPDVALLDIQTKRINLVFEIGADYCKLIEQKEPELQRLVDKDMSPGILLNELMNSGILLVPNDEDFKLAGLAKKDKNAEERAIWDVVTSVNAYAFRSAKWNRNPSLKDNIVVKIRENLEYDREFFEDYEPDWRYIMWWRNKCSFADCIDTDENYDRKVNIPEGNETHVLLSLTLQNNASEEALERCNNYTHIRFIQTLKKFLRILRLLAFS
eukprot:CAMPEP_0196996914 /NCGR_PEP_ID=MMETSP1380-20130617/2684_1 /TAXON_ID=5936 /ORGANISM="Euplotes crassus, Strain CT5" /LENGTH=435 /DNA_ID=CAMNT_0042413031 /DNA_START=553 /DNA_END=1860 /DNA_ORIENTATION=-